MSSSRRLAVATGGDAATFPISSAAAADAAWSVTSGKLSQREWLMNVENENTSLMNSVTQLVQLIFLWRCWVKWSHGWWSCALAFHPAERERTRERERFFCVGDWKKNSDFCSPGAQAWLFFFYLISSQLTTLSSDLLCRVWQIHGRVSVKGRCSFIFLIWW